MIPSNQNPFFRFPNLPQDVFADLPEKIEIYGLRQIEEIGGGVGGKSTPPPEIKFDLVTKKMEDGEDCHCLAIVPTQGGPGLNVFMTKHKLGFQISVPKEKDGDSADSRAEEKTA